MDMYSLKLPVYISENGFGHAGMETPDAKDGMIHDDDRINYLSRALQTVDSMLGEGMDIRGYYLWSLMDNFEWSAGNTYRYGIIHTDFDTYRRTWKKSAYWYRDYIRQNRAVRG